MLTFKILAILLLVAGLLLVFRLPRDGQVMGSYATSLAGRTHGQRHNARRAAQALDGLVIAPKALFSFNKSVGWWSPDRGYVRAPVSYDGELVVDWGGGVCQTSTTLYNAALLAGLTVVQRNRHNWAPKYVPPGRDAAVAQTDIDLQLRNPYPWPVTIHAQSKRHADRLYPPWPHIRPDGLRRRRHPNEHGADRGDQNRRPPAARRTPRHQSRPPGIGVSVYRTYLRGPRAGTRELVSQDSYPAMERIVAVGVWIEFRQN